MAGINHWERCRYRRYHKDGKGRSRSPATEDLMLSLRSISNNIFIYPHGSESLDGTLDYKLLDRAAPGDPQVPRYGGVTYLVQFRRQSTRCDLLHCCHGRLWLRLLLELRLLQPSPDQQQELLHRGCGYWPALRRTGTYRCLHTSLLNHPNC